MEDKTIGRRVNYPTLYRYRKRGKWAGRSMRDIAEALNLSLGFVHKMLNVNLRTVKALYCNGL